MRRGWIAVVLAANIALAVSAQAGAEPIAPEFGRCVKAPKGETGAGYSDSHCNAPVSSGATYHWLSGPGGAPGFQASTGSVALTLQATGGKRPAPVITCAGSKATGELTGASSEELELILTGCSMSSVSCRSAGAAAGEVAFAPLEGIPEVVRTTQQGEALIRWSPVLGETLASFECGATSVLITNSMMHQVRDDKMETSEAERFRIHRSGTQDPECGQPCEAGEQPSTSIAGGTATPSGFAMSGSQTNGEGIELRTIV